MGEKKIFFFFFFFLFCSSLLKHQQQKERSCFQNSHPKPLNGNHKGWRKIWFLSVKIAFLLLGFSPLSYLRDWTKFFFPYFFRCLHPKVVGLPFRHILPCSVIWYAFLFAGFGVLFNFVFLVLIGPRTWSAPRGGEGEFAAVSSQIWGVSGAEERSRVGFEPSGCGWCVRW